MKKFTEGKFYRALGQIEVFRLNLNDDGDIVGEGNATVERHQVIRIVNREVFRDAYGRREFTAVHALSVDENVVLCLVEEEDREAFVRAE